MFRAFGHQKSSILDGGLPRWEAEGFETVGTPPTEMRRSTYPTPFHDGAVVRCETSFALSANRIRSESRWQPMNRW